MITIEIKQGKRGKFRWLAYQDGKFVCIGRIQGSESRERALRRAKSVFSDSVTVEGEYGEEFAGERDFSD